MGCLFTLLMVSFDESKLVCLFVCFVCLFKFILFIYFLAVLGLCCGAQASHCGGFSCCGAQGLGARASVGVALGFSSCGLCALERRLSTCGART